MGVQNLIGEELERLDFSTRYYAHPEGKFADLLVGERIHSEYSPWINLIAHADTVLPSFNIEMGPHIWKGAGIADNKGGVVTLLQTLWNLKKSPLPYNLRVVISPNEEAGSPGFHELFGKWGKGAFLNLGFEPALENDELIESRNGNRWYEITLKGTSAHAGRAPKGRVNLLHRLSQLVLNLETTLVDDQRTKFNVASIETPNKRYNVIPDEVTVKIDARFNSFKGREKFHRALMDEMDLAKASCELTGSEVEVSFHIADDCPPMGLSETHCFNDLPFPFDHSGGAADINYFSTAENLSLDGWGGRGCQLHSKEEWLDIASIFHRAEVLSNWMRTLDRVVMMDKTAKASYPDYSLVMH
jgi:glutamate carboxypeptidase